MIPGAAFGIYGIAQDLSFLTQLSTSDIESLQCIGGEFQERKKYILKDDQEEMWHALMSLNDQRVDIILDNGKSMIWDFFSLINFSCIGPAGFEVIFWFFHALSLPLLNVMLQLFTDLVFADFLVTYTPHVSQVVFQYVLLLCNICIII